MNSIYTENAQTIKHHDKIFEITRQILEYTERVRQGQVQCNLPPCRCCKSDIFKQHATRERQFYVTSEDMVKVILGLLNRWKCLGCGKTFTDYPEFAVPYKRYIVPIIKKYISLYTEDHLASYRKIIIRNCIGYPDSEQQLNHTSIHRWIKTFGSYSKIIRTAQDIYLQAKPQSSICRELTSLSIPLAKYRTQERKTLLQRCRQLLKIEVKFWSVFQASIFTRLATQCGFT